MRRSAISVAASALATVLLLSACGGADSDADATAAAMSTETASASAPPAGEAAGPTEADVAALEAVTVEGEPGEEPTVTFDQPFTVTAPVARLVSEGTGEELVEGQLVSLDFITISGADGATVGTTYGATPQTLTLGDAGVVTALNEVLAGQKIGARVLFATPDADGSAAVMAIDVVDAVTVPDRAEGEAVAPAEGLPVVTLAENGEPSIEPVEGDAPTELVIQPLIEGDGPVVESGQNLTMHYSGWLWDGTPFDSSWANGAPFSTQIDVGRVIQGWDTGLVGQKVGSQVMLVIPPEMGYGEAGSPPTIPANSTLIFVVDILSAT